MGKLTNLREVAASPVRSPERAELASAIAAKAEAARVVEGAREASVRARSMIEHAEAKHAAASAAVSADAPRATPD